MDPQPHPHPPYANHGRSQSFSAPSQRQQQLGQQHHQHQLQHQQQHSHYADYAASELSLLDSMAALSVSQGQTNSLSLGRTGNSHSNNSNNQRQINHSTPQQLSLQRQNDVNRMQAQSPRSNGGGPDKKSNLYKTEFCRSMEETSECRYGNKCQFAHTKDELRLVDRHPKYKTQLCKTYFDTGDCPYGRRCCFIHSSSGGDETSEVKTPTYAPQRSKSFSALSPVSKPGTPNSAAYGNMLQHQQQQQNMLAMQQQQARFHQQQLQQQQLHSPPMQAYDDEPVSVIPTNPALFRNNYPSPIQTSILSPAPADVLLQGYSQNMARTASPYSKPSTPVSSLAGQAPTRRSSASQDNFQLQQRMRVRQQSYQQDSISEDNLGPLRPSSAVNDEYMQLALLRQQQRSAASMREMSGSARETPSRIGTPGMSALENQQQQYYLYQQHQLQQQQLPFGSSLDSTPGLTSQFQATPPSSLSSAVHGSTGPDSLFFENRRTSLENVSILAGSNGQLLSPLSSFADDNAGFAVRASGGANSTGFDNSRSVSQYTTQRRTRSATQPVTQNEELEELFYLNQYQIQQQQQTNSSQNSNGYLNQNQGFSGSSGNQGNVFHFESDDASSPTSGSNGNSRNVSNSFLNAPDIDGYGRAVTAGSVGTASFIPRSVEAGSRQHLRAVSHSGLGWGDL